MIDKCTCYYSGDVQIGTCLRCVEMGNRDFDKGYDKALDDVSAIILGKNPSKRMERVWIDLISENLVKKTNNYRNY